MTQSSAGTPAAQQPQHLQGARRDGRTRESAGARRLDDGRIGPQALARQVVLVAMMPASFSRTDELGDRSTSSS